MRRPKAWLSWSTGKDSAWALHEVRARGEVEVVALLTTLNSAHQRVAMHAVREALLDAQVETLGLPVIKIPIPPNCVNAVYEEAMANAMASARAEGVFHVVFGDLFLADVRLPREAPHRLREERCFPVVGPGYEGARGGDGRLGRPRCNHLRGPQAIESRVCRAHT